MIVSAMRNHSNYPDVQASACAALCVLASHTSNTRETISEHNGIAHVLEAMKNHADHAVVQANACGVLAWLALDIGKSKFPCKEA